MKGKVLSVFAGLGKTVVAKKYENVCDLATSKYRYDYTNVNPEDYEKLKNSKNNIRNKEWPNNYIKELFNAIEYYDIVLVPSNQDIRDILQNNGIDFVFILPDKKLRDTLIKRYQDRKNSSELIHTCLKNFDNWSREQKDYDYPIEILAEDKYLEDFLLKKGYIK